VPGRLPVKSILIHDKIKVEKELELWDRKKGKGIVLLISYNAGRYHTRTLSVRQALGDE
jgi:hypothetical protein